MVVPPTPSNGRVSSQLESTYCAWKSVVLVILQRLLPVVAALIRRGLALWELTTYCPRSYPGVQRLPRWQGPLIRVPSGNCCCLGWWRVHPPNPFVLCCPVMVGSLERTTSSSPSCVVADLLLAVRG
jgi:hypothetical protein